MYTFLAALAIIGGIVAGVAALNVPVMQGNVALLWALIAIAEFVFAGVMGIFRIVAILESDRKPESATRPKTKRVMPVQPPPPPPTYQ